jgi:hypothetical protein
MPTRPSPTSAGKLEQSMTDEQQPLNLKDINNWTAENGNVLADKFGFVYNQEFIGALDEYLHNVVAGATITDSLEIFAEKHFSRYQPPLTKAS